MWAGGKTKLLKHYIPMLPKKVDTYYEPFFGGGALFLYVMQHYQPKKVIINDINADIINIYRAVKEDIKNFRCELDKLETEYINKTKEARKQFYFAVRHQHAYHYFDWSRTKEAATLYFLMKTGFNGIYQINKNTNNRFGTPAGLLNQVDSIYNRNVLLHWHTILQSVELYSTDWSQLYYTDNYNTFVFFDPPYRGCFTSYGQQFDDNQQLSLLDQAKTFKQARVFLSNRDIGDGFFENNRGALNQVAIPVTYTAGRRKQTNNGYEAKKAVEVLLYN